MLKLKLTQKRAGIKTAYFTKGLDLIISKTSYRFRSRIDAKHQKLHQMAQNKHIFWLFKPVCISFQSWMKLTSLIRNNTKILLLLVLPTMHELYGKHLCVETSIDFFFFFPSSRALRQQLHRKWKLHRRKVYMLQGLFWSWLLSRNTSLICWRNSL